MSTTHNRTVKVSMMGQPSHKQNIMTEPITQSYIFRE